MIIIEGSDGAGKTTLVNKLAEELGLEIGQRATSDRDKLYTVTRQDTYRALAHAVEGHKAPYIWDRLFYSEMIYAPVVGRQMEFTLGEQTWVRRVLAAIGIPVVVCRPPLEVVKENTSRTHQMDLVADNIDAIYRSYTGAFIGHPHVMWFDYTNTYDMGEYHTYSELVERLSHYIRSRGEREW